PGIGLTIRVLTHRLRPCQGAGRPNHLSGRCDMKTATKLAIPLGIAALTAGVMLFADATASPPASPTIQPTKGDRDMPTGADNFYKSDTVTVQKVTFKNQYRMTVG